MDTSAADSLETTLAAVYATGSPHAATIGTRRPPVACETTDVRAGWAVYWLRGGRGAALHARWNLGETGVGGYLHGNIRL